MELLICTQSDKLIWLQQEMNTDMFASHFASQQIATLLKPLKLLQAVGMHVLPIKLIIVAPVQISLMAFLAFQVKELWFLSLPLNATSRAETHPDM